MKKDNTLIKNTDHCAICDLSKTNLKLGLICSLTSHTPIFYKSCTNIKLDEKLEEKSDELYLQRDILNFKNKKMYLRLFLFPLLGILVLILDYFFYLKYIKPYDMLSAENGAYYPSSVLGVLACIFILGCALFGKGIGPFLNYQEDKKMNKEKITKLETILKLYKIY
ncbi:hypothetical protein [Tenacibaculum jejuense]|uniref:Uncharacterized protein n=1 Tax=Tenacibaculum jejuense TaxID=584609 RepID=A0A238UA65_9FLAO|nr:hypothetical protein [Tenacibaculum jejuense]SNR16087.1 Probable transmembrane protein of unknown function [Tenacibaculum jejuense]